MIQHGKPETYPPSVTEDSGVGPREQGTPRPCISPRQVNNDRDQQREAQGLCSHQMPDPLFPLLAHAQGISHQLYCGKRPGQKLIQRHLSASAIPV